jgi:cysteine desulfurase family protein
MEADSEGLVILIYLNNAATSWPKPEAVYRTADQYLRCLRGSPGRGGYGEALAAGRAVLETRELLARLFGIAAPEKIVFTANATEALNLVIRGFLEPGDHVIMSSMEHNSVARLLFVLQQEGVDVSIINCAADGTLDLTAVEGIIRSRTRLICLTHASNVTGTIMPISELGAIAGRHKIYFLVDAAQTAGEIPLDIDGAQIDFLAFTGHKGLFGPPGTGGLYLRYPEIISPLQYGGTGSQSELLSQPQMMPDRFESGTLNAPGIAALGAGVKFILETGLEAIRGHARELTAMFMEGLKELPGITIYGPADISRRLPVISLNMKGISPGEASTWLAAKYDIVTRSGLHCAPLAHKTIGTIKTGTLRFSLSFFNTAYEVRQTVAALQELAQEVGSKKGLL